ncbi:MAG: hypothetical protein FWH03_02405 [Firmicutes bacterium]|nr:hypothetical protein [Bacillota bacterium]
MKIIIENKLASRDGRKGVFTYSTTGRRKTGFLIYDEQNRNIGIVFMSDDERKDCKYGMSEILFDENFEKEFGTWKIIKINRAYLSFDKLKEIMSKNERYTLYID